MLGFLTDVIDYVSYGQASDDPLFRVDHRRRDQVVAFEGLCGVVCVVARFEADDGFGAHQRADQGFRVVGKQLLQGQNAVQVFIAIHHEELVGVFGQLFEAPQIAQHHLQGDVLANRHHVEVHQRTDRVLRVGHGCAQLLALFGVQRLEHVLDDFGGQVGCKVGKLVGVQALGSRPELLRVHGLDERFAHCIRDFQQNLAIALCLDQIPDKQAILERQGLEDEGDVCRVKLLQPVLKLGEMLSVDQVLDQVVTRHVLAQHQILDQLLARQKLLHITQMLLDVVGFAFDFFGHGLRSRQT